MTPADIVARLRARADAEARAYATDPDCYHGDETARVLREEADAYEREAGPPVLRRCGDCSHNALPYYSPERMCEHGLDDNERASRAAPADAPPPDWCPLREEKTR